MSVVVFQIGARRHYAVPRALALHGRLERLVTDANADLWPSRGLRAIPAHLRGRWLANLLGRSAAPIPASQQRGLPLFTLSRTAGRLIRQGEAQIVYWQRQNRAFCRSAAKVGFGNARVVYAYNGAALELFAAAREQGLLCVLDQTAAATRHDASLLQRESAKWPMWSNPEEEWQAWQDMAAREEKEWELADAIICGSPYVRETVAAAGGPADRCHVVRYSTTPPTLAAPRHHPEAARPLRVLFIGTLGLRKGLPYLHETAELLGKAFELRVVGPSELPPRAMELLRSCCDVRGPVPRHDVVELYGWADIFVLPTLSEGSANVCFEALGHALPVITTYEAGSVVVDQREGLLVPAGNSKALADAIRHIAGTPEDYSRMSAAALTRAREFTSERYARQLLGVICQLAGTGHP